MLFLDVSDQNELTSFLKEHSHFSNWYNIERKLVWWMTVNSSWWQSQPNVCSETSYSGPIFKNVAKWGAIKIFMNVIGNLDGLKIGQNWRRAVVKNADMGKVVSKIRRCLWMVPYVFAAFFPICQMHNERILLQK